jgi:hypothetical protein
LLEVYGGPKLPPNLPSIARKGVTYAMDTHEEDFALMRLAFLRAALEEAEAVGDGPTSWVSLERVAERLGAELSGEASAVLLSRYGEMARHYWNLEDLTDLDIREGGFRLTEQGVAAARGEE